MINNCRECRQMCDFAGKNQRVADCERFEAAETLVLYTDDIRSFPERLVIKSKDTDKELVYMPIL